MSYDWCNVLCRNLPADIRDADLFELFTPYGKILSSRVMWDSQLNCSKGYGFVRFSKPEEAQDAIKEMDKRMVRGKNLLCSVSFVQEEETEMPCDNLYIKYLPDQVSDQELEEIFQPYGTILQCRVMVDNLTKFTKRVGFVRFSTVEEAINARKALNGKSVCDSPFLLNIKFAETPEQKAMRKYKKFTDPAAEYGAATPYLSPASYPINFGGFVPGYPAPATPFIQITYCPYHPFHPHHPDLAEYVPQDVPYYGEPQGDEKYEQQKISWTKGTKRNPQRQYAETKRKPIPSTNLFVFHLPSNIEKLEVEELFSRYGELQSVNLPLDKGTKMPKGYAFVTFVRLEDAVEARACLDKYAIGAKIMRVDFNQTTQPQNEAPQSH